MLKNERLAEAIQSHAEETEPRCPPRLPFPAYPPTCPAIRLENHVEQKESLAVETETHAEETDSPVEEIEEVVPQDA